MHTDFESLALILCAHVMTYTVSPQMPLHERWKYRMKLKLLAKQPNNIILPHNGATFVHLTKLPLLS